MVEGVLVCDVENRIELSNASLRQLLGLGEVLTGNHWSALYVRAELKNWLRLCASR